MDRADRTQVPSADDAVIEFLKGDRVRLAILDTIMADKLRQKRRYRFCVGGWN